jgi:hypothetical protein
MGALLVLATIIIFFGSYLLQYLSLDGWSLYAGFSNAVNRGH